MGGKRRLLKGTGTGKVQVRTELCGILRSAVDLRLCKRARVDSARRCSLPVGDADLNWAIVGISIGGEKLQLELTRTLDIGYIPQAISRYEYMETPEI